MEKRVNIQGMVVSRLRRSELVDRIISAAKSGAGLWVITANTDYLRRYKSDRNFARAVNKADIIVADGMPLVWISRILGDPIPERLTGVDLVDVAVERLARGGIPTLLLGGDGETAMKYREKILSKHGENVPLFAYSPMIDAPPTMEQCGLLSDYIKSVKAKVVFVAFGSPKQDYAIEHLRAMVPGVVWVGVGVTFSILSGEIARAPRALQKLGGEWLWRLVCEPRKLWRRYLVQGIPFVLLLLISTLFERIRQTKE